VSTARCMHWKHVDAWQYACALAQALCWAPGLMRMGCAPPTQCALLPSCKQHVSVHDLAGATRGVLLRELHVQHAYELMSCCTSSSLCCSLHSVCTMWWRAVTPSLLPALHTRISGECTAGVMWRSPPNKQ